jgi:NitT/TauT family transport system substrate-binding protein
MDATQKQSSRRKIIIIVTSLILLGLAASLLWFYGKRRQPAQETSYSGPIEKITIGNIGEYSVFNLIAKEKGFFKENGLEPEIQEFASGPPAVTALLEGKVDVAVAADYVGVINLFSSENLRILAQASKHQVFQVVARKDKGIEEAADLKGKKVGVTKRSAGEFYLGRFLAFNNLSISDLTIIDLPPAEMNRQIETGDLDAVVTFDPHAYNIQKKLGNNIIIWSAQGEQKTFAITYSTNTYIQDHPDIIKRYLRSLFEAEDYMKEKPTEAKNLMARLLKYDPSYVDYMLRNFTFAQGLDQELLFSMEDQARWAIDNHLTEKNTVPNYLNSIYFPGLEGVKPEAITIIR